MSWVAAVVQVPQAAVAAYASKRHEVITIDLRTKFKRCEYCGTEPTDTYSTTKCKECGAPLTKRS